MSKKHSIGGFGAHFQNDRDPKEDELNEKLEKDKPAIEEELVALIFERYSPADNLQESTDQKTTLDLIDEMESTTSPCKSIVTEAMKNFGFKLHYTGDQYVWLLKERQ